MYWMCCFYPLVVGTAWVLPCLASARLLMHGRASCLWWNSDAVPPPEACRGSCCSARHCWAESWERWGSFSEHRSLWRPPAPFWQLPFGHGSLVLQQAPIRSRLSTCVAAQRAWRRPTCSYSLDPCKGWEAEALPQIHWLYGSSGMTWCHTDREQALPDNPWKTRPLESFWINYL